jgi:hypothetical protein
VRTEMCASQYQEARVALAGGGGTQMQWPLPLSVLARAALDFETA